MCGQWDMLCYGPPTGAFLKKTTPCLLKACTGNSHLWAVKACETNCHKNGWFANAVLPYITHTYTK